MSRAGSLNTVETPQHLALGRVSIGMRLRLAIYGAASLFLLAFYAPARVATSLIASLRER
jgi:hypothetical protein